MTTRKTLHGRRLRWIFHESSKNFALEEAKRPDQPDSWSEIQYKQYETGTSVQFSADVELDDDLRETLSNRRSPGVYALEQTPVSTADVSLFVGEAAGITHRGETKDDHYRAYPSGGAKYPLEVYVAVLNGADLEEGIYHYNVKNDRLDLLRTEDVVAELDFFYKEIREHVSAVVFVTARLERTTQKYGERGYRYAHVEAGHLMQNVCLLAERRDLACHPYGGFIEDRADAYLRLQSDPETTLYIGFVGGTAR